MGSWSKISYSQRLFLWLLSYSVLLVGCFVCFQYHREKKFKADKLNAQLQLINSHLLEALVTPCAIYRFVFQHFSNSAASRRASRSAAA